MRGKVRGGWRHGTNEDMNRSEPAPVVDISDAALMQRLARGDARALAPLHQRYGQRVTSLLLRVGPGMSLEQAEDLSQEVFLTLLETAPRYVEQDRLRSWLFGIAVRKARAWHRRRWVRRRLRLERAPDLALSTAAPPGAAPDRLEVHEQVDRALRGLPRGQREALVLHAVEGLSGEEIAAILGISVSAVWVRLHRARKGMRAALKMPRGEEHG